MKKWSSNKAMKTAWMFVRHACGNNMEIRTKRNIELLFLLASLFSDRIRFFFFLCLNFNWIVKMFIFKDKPRVTGWIWFWLHQLSLIHQQLFRQFYSFKLHVFPILYSIHLWPRGHLSVNTQYIIKMPENW